MSGEVRYGIAFLKPDDTDSAIEWTVPAAGAFLLSVDPNRGPSRADVLNLTVSLSDGKDVSMPVAGKAAVCGRGQWQDLGILTDAMGTRIKLTSAKNGFSCLDILRLTPVKASDIAVTDTKQTHEFTIQWDDPSPQRPLLRDVTAVSTSDEAVQILTIQPAAGF